MIGRTIGKYRVLERIGRGGMGTVYRAVDETLEREVAIKVLNADVTEPEALKRFRTEAITLARLQHPAIATLFELTEDDGNLLMVMEFVRGETLQKLAERMGRVPADFAAQLCSQALDGLWHAHRAGIVHRDLKPGNLMVTGDGIVKVMDFGIARIAGSEHLTSDGFTMGTPAYMAPEQIRGEEVDARTDLYAMGVVLYRLWTGQLPFQGDTAFAIAHRQLNESPIPLKEAAPDLPSWCDLVLSRAMAKNASERYQTALEFKNALSTAATFMSLDDVATVTLRTPRAVVLPTRTSPAPAPDDSSRAVQAPISVSSPVPPPESVATPRNASAAQNVAEPSSASPSVALPAATPASGTASSVAASSGTVPVATAPPATGRTVVISPRHVFAGVTSLMIVLVVLAIGTVLAVKRLQQQKSAAASEQAVVTPVPDVSAPSPPPAPAPPSDTGSPSSLPAAGASTGTPPPVEQPPAQKPSVPAPAKAAPATASKSAASPVTPSTSGKTAAPAAPPAKPLPSAPEPAPVPAPVADTSPAVTFDKVKLLVVEGDKAREDDAELRFANGAVQILGPSNKVVGTLPYQSVRTVTSTRSKQPRWRGPDGTVVDAKMSSGAFGFLKSDRNWVGLVTPTTAYVFRVDDGDLQKLTETATKRTGAPLVRLAGK